MSGNVDQRKTARWLGFAAVVLSVGVAPLAWDPSGLQAFLHLKLIFVGAALLIGAAALRHHRSTIPGDRRLLIAIAALLVITAVAAATSDDPWSAILGASTRQVGWFAFAAFAAMFVLGFNLWTADIDGTKLALMVGSMAACYGIGFLAVLEVLDAAPFHFDQEFSGRVQGIFGNPAITAAYLCLVVPVAVAAALDVSRSVAQRSIAAGASAIGIFAVASTGSRGAAVGLIAVGVVAAILAARRHMLRLAAVVALSAVIGMVIVVIVTSGRWASIQDDLQGRADLWAIGANATLARPVLGYGPEGFSQAFAEHVEADFVIEYSRDQVYDRAHNGVLDMTVAVGIPGGLLYLGLLLAVGVLVVRAAGSENIVLVGVGLGVAAYMLQQQFLFPIATADHVGWLFVGVLAGALARTPPIPANRAVPAVLLLVGLGVSLYAVLGILADRLDKAALDGPVEAAQDRFEQAAGLRPIDDLHYWLAGALARASGDPVVLSGAVEFVSEAQRSSPTNELLALELASMKIQEHRFIGGQTPLRDAVALLAERLAWDPHNGQALLRLGTAEYLLGNRSAAEVHWVEAARLMPHEDAPKNNLAILRAEETP